MLNSIQEFFKSHFHKDPQVVSAAPGRLEILGNHTDYNEGFVLSAATGQKTVFAAAKTSGRLCRVMDQCYGKEAVIDLDDLATAEKGDWANYLKGALTELAKRNVTVGAFDMVLASTVPLSAGMSSSAALEVAFLYALKELFAISFPPGEWARIGQGVENNYMGLPHCGSIGKCSHDRRIQNRCGQYSCETQSCGIRL